MHLIEQYALSCGVKINKPFIETSYFPVVPKKYITLHASARIQSKTYDYYNDVVTLLRPFLIKKGIHIVQIGSNKESSISNCIQHQGQTSIKQAAYIIKNSLLHLSTDSFSTHVASGFDKKIVSLYSTLYKECCGPYWGDKSRQILLEPDRKKRKASFSDTEYPKSINTIMPEEISRSVLDLLEIDHNLRGVETFHIGDSYHSGSLAVIPNHVMPSDFAPSQPANILGNEHFNEENITKWAFNRKVNIFLDRPMQINYLKSVRQNVNQINYFATPDDNESFFKAASKLGIKIKIISKDKNIINDLKLKFFDWDVDLIIKKSKKDIDNADKICNNTRYKSSQIIASENKLYASKAAWKSGINGHHDTIIDCEEFWDDLTNLKLYNDNNYDKDSNKDR